jgi:Na+/H+-dicarboxylate symporter
MRGHHFKTVIAVQKLFHFVYNLCISIVTWQGNKGLMFCKLQYNNFYKYIIEEFIIIFSNDFFYPFKV